MLLLDTNILLYATKPYYESLVKYLELNKKHISVSVITKLEALGTTNLFDYQKSYLENFFLSVNILPVTTSIADIAIELRQARKISLPDALIAATALYHGSTLVTRNITDFSKIELLDIIDPVLID